MKFHTFDPERFKDVWNKIRQTSRPDPELIRAIGEAELASAQAELALSTNADLRAETEYKKRQMKRRTR